MDNPVLNDAAADLSALQSMIAEADAGNDPSSANIALGDETIPATRAGEDTGEIPAEVTAADSPDTSAAPDAKPPAPKPPKAEEQAPTEEAPKPGEKPPSAFEKAKKDAARRDESWKALNAEKERLKTEREQFAREREQATRQRQPQAPTNNKPPAATLKDERGYTADDYADAARQFAENGDDALAKQATERANQLRGAEQQQAAAADQQQFAGLWQRNMEDTIKAEPDLGKADSAVSKEMRQLLESEPLFGRIPDGFAKAASIAKLRVEASLASGLKAENARQKQEIERLTKLTQISGGGPGAMPGGAKTFDAMSTPELERHLERELATADGASGW